MPSLRHIALALAVAAIGLFALELALRGAGIGAQFWTRPDAQLGWVLRPGAAGEINSNGQRDREHALDKGDDVYRIAVLGDDVSEALQVAPNDTYWSLLASRLEACGFQEGKTIEVLNFGVRGFGTAQETVMLETTAMRYQPDLVLLQFANGDDVQNNSFALAQEKDRPFYFLDARGRLRIDESFAGGPGFRRHASLLRELARKLADRSRVLQLAFTLPEMPPARRAHAAGHQSALFAAPRDALWEEAWRVTEALIAHMHAYAARNGAGFVVVSVPHAIQMSENDLLYQDRRIAAFAGTRGIRAMSLTREMRESSKTRPLYREQHWNEEGHRVAAGLIARRLCGAIPASAAAGRAGAARNRVDRSAE